MIQDTDKCRACASCVHRGDVVTCEECEDASGYEFEPAVDVIVQMANGSRITFVQAEGT